MDCTLKKHRYVSFIHNATIRRIVYKLKFKTSPGLKARVLTVDISQVK